MANDMGTTKPSIDGYDTAERLGSGGTADVWMVRDRQGRAFAAKVFRSESLQAGRREWKALNRHAGSHIVPALDLVRTAQGQTALIMPYLSGGTLTDVVSGRGELTCAEVVTALMPVAQVLAQLHQAGSVHGDLTPRNIMFDDIGKPFVTDLGATRVPAEPGRAEWGSAGFVAPELLDGEGPTSSSDMYSWGASAWFALTGEPPQPPALRPQLIDIVSDVPQELGSLISGCLSMTPSARPDAHIAARRLGEVAPPASVPVIRTPHHSGIAHATDPVAAAADMTKRLREDARPGPFRVTGGERKSIVGLHRASEGRRSAGVTASGGQRSAGPSTRRSSSNKRSMGRGADADRPTGLPSRSKSAQHLTGGRLGASRVIVGLAVMAAAGLVAWFVPVPGGSQSASAGVGAASGSASLKNRPLSASPVAGGVRSRATSDSPSAASTATRADATEPGPAAMAPAPGDLAKLLACRAQAWNALSTALLDGCLAPQSQAHHDDTKLLNEARSQQRAYRGVAFEVTRVDSTHTIEGKPVVMAQIRRSAFTVHTTAGITHQDPQTSMVRFSFANKDGRWLISSWSEQG